ncbi:MAG: ribbon-helix-helix protein, CopG family [Chloroflexi bacterium]|nr:ribbon-helix-helix protein, CopG family [Chloroflexota bacterium]
MEQQLSLRLSETLTKQLDAAARRLHRNRSDVVRLALEQFLAVQIETRPIDRVRDLIGRVESGVPDLGQQHRAYLKKRIRNAR